MKNLKRLNNTQLLNIEKDQSERTLTFDSILKNGLNLISRPRTLKYSFVTDYCKEISFERSLYNELDEKTIQAAVNGPIADHNWTQKVFIINPTVIEIVSFLHFRSQLYALTTVIYSV